MNVMSRGLVVILTGFLLTACGGNSSSTDPGGNGSASSSPAGTAEIAWMYPAQGLVEVLELDLSNPASVTGSLHDVYNCGDGQSGTAPSPISVTGTETDPTTLELQFAGSSEDVQATTTAQGADLTNSSGSSVAWQLITNSNSLSGAVQQEPPISSISGSTCASLPDTMEP
jgi:hypothetical protein